MFNKIQITKITLLFFICIFSTFIEYTQAKATKNNLALAKGQVMDIMFFDIKKFEQNRNGSEWNFIRPDGTKVRQIKSSKDYIVELTPPLSAYTHINVYNTKGAIKIKAVRFYGLDIGQWLYFDEQQQVIKELDHEKLYPISIEALAKIMKDEYWLDIFDTSKIFMIQRYVDNQNTHKPLYEVHAYKGDGTDWLNSYLIEAETGKLLYTMQLFLHDEDKGLYSEYIKSTPEYKQGIYKLEEE